MQPNDNTASTTAIPPPPIIAAPAPPIPTSASTTPAAPVASPSPSSSAPSLSTTVSVASAAPVPPIVPTTVAPAPPGALTGPTTSSGGGSAPLPTSATATTTATTAPATTTTTTTSTKDQEKQRLSNSIVEAVSQLDSAFVRLEKVEKQLNLGVTAAPVKNVSSKPPTPVRDYDDLMSSWIAPMTEAAILLGDVIEEQFDLLYTLATATRSLILQSCLCKRPSDDSLMFKAINDLITELHQFTEKLSPSSKLYHEHLTLVSKGVPLFGWVLSSNPVQHIQSLRPNVENLISKFVKESKSRPEQISIMDNYNNFLKALENYVVKHHSNGLTWNSSGKDAPLKLNIQSRGAFLPRPYVGVPKMYLDGTKFYSEYQTGDKTVDIDSDKKIVFHILSGMDASLCLRGRPQSLIIDGCNLTKVALMDGAQNIEINNSKNITVAIQGSESVVTHISVCRTIGCLIELSDLNSNADINIIGSTDVHFNLLKDDTTDIVEIPTQIKTKIKQGKVHTVLVSSNK